MSVKSRNSQIKRNFDRKSSPPPLQSSHRLFCLFRRKSTWEVDKDHPGKQSHGIIDTHEEIALKSSPRLDSSARPSINISFICLIIHKISQENFPSAVKCLRRRKRLDDEKRRLRFCWCQLKSHKRDVKEVQKRSFFNNHTIFVVNTWRGRRFMMSQIHKVYDLFAGKCFGNLILMTRGWKRSQLIKYRSIP